MEDHACLLTDEYESTLLLFTLSGTAFVAVYTGQC